MKVGNIVIWNGDFAKGTVGEVIAVSDSQIAIKWDDGVVSYFAPKSKRVQNVGILKEKHA